jgi:transposase-like protein
MSVTIDPTDPIFHDEEAARPFRGATLPNGPYCPHCGSITVIRMTGAKHRAGAFNCRDCRKAFSATVGTVFESSKVALYKWMLANHLMNASKKGVSAHQLHRMIHVTYKTAWFMEHRLREAMTTPNAPPLGGEGKVVEADEAYHGKRETQVPRSRNATKKFT